MAKIEEPPLLELKEAAAIGADQAPVYDESGTVDPDFLRDVTETIEVADTERMRALGGRLHEAISVSSPHRSNRSCAHWR